MLHDNTSKQRYGLVVIPLRDSDPGELHYRQRRGIRSDRPNGCSLRHPNLLDYANIDRAVAWHLMAGAYTRFGDVTELLEAADDCFVIMGRGEEITLGFAAAAFGPVPPGMTRSFILKTDSFCKDMDLYTACGDSVEPLPFHGMSGYPYGKDEAYPGDERHREYRRRFNTRIIRVSRDR